MPKSPSFANSLLAIVVGGVSDVLLSSLLGFGFALYVTLSRHLEALPQGQMQRALIATVHDSPLLRAVETVIGLGCSVLGGYIAASIARQRKLRHGVMASWLCVAIGLFSQIDFGPGALLWRLVLIALTPLCYLAGAYLRTRKRVAQADA